MTDARREYEEALAAYYAAQERLTSARQKAEHAAWLASPERIEHEERYRRMVEEYNRRGIAT